MGTIGVAQKGGVAVTGSYEQAVDTLDAELRGVEAVFRGLSDEQWKASTKLQPLDPNLRHWTVFELAGHFDLSIGLARMLMADPSRANRVGTV